MPAHPVPVPRPRRGAAARALAVVVVAVLVLGAAACSSDDDETSSSTSGGDTTTTTEALPELTDTEQEFADALLAQLEAEAGIFSGGDNECLAARWVAAVGGDRLTEAGILPEQFALSGPTSLELDDATAEEMVAAMETCGATMEKLYRAFAMDEETKEVDEDVLACMEEAAPVAEFRAAMVASFTGDGDAALEAVGKKWEACG